MKRDIIKFFVILLLIIFSTTICYAATKLTKKQRLDFYVDITSAINHLKQDQIYDAPDFNRKLTTIEFLNYLHEKNINIYNQFLANKNVMKNNKESVDILSNYSLKELYNDFLGYYISPIVVKYNIILDGRLNYYEDFEISYLNKYDIPNVSDYRNIRLLINEYQSETLNIIKEITDYSKQYENTKKANYIKNKQALGPKIYGIPYLKVIQVLNDGFLAERGGWDDNVVFIRSGNAYKLVDGDYINDLPIKDNGKRYRYINTYGAIRTVVEYQEVTPAEFNKYMKITNIPDKFYFIDSKTHCQTFNISATNYMNSKPYLNGYTICQ